ncbi:ABC transporter ATP-binding protein [Gudongella sp. DL1XJH-153]|uniref:ABC transporter ATP-binding protein n=1 Tax=Gudongella sp. DL1XJH-153 TaxID=3409804 RepID=UPI003BB4DDCE
MEERKPLLQLQNLKKYFDVSTGFFKREKAYLTAVDDVTFDIYKGETFGLVGESGCGKSTLGRSVVRLYEPTGGKILYDGEDITNLSQHDMMKYRKRLQMIFQDPYASLNTRLTVSEIIGEGIETHNLYSGKEKLEKIYNLLQTVGLKREHASRYPHEFSGGQRQRIGIARSLAVEPDLIVCDEPISALDVSIQAQVVNMLEDLQNDMGLTYLFIAHDLSMVKHISDRIGVMYLGKMMEITSSKELYKNPLHPYTQALLSAIPIPDPKSNKMDKRIILQGDVKSPINPPEGCRFSSRCRYCMDICTEVTPELREVEPGHFVACHLVK